MLFELSNAIASFSGYVNKIPVGNLNVFVIVYLDHIFISTKDESQDHVKAI